MRRPRQRAWIFAAALAGCTGVAPAPEPVTLTFPADAPDAIQFDGYRRLAARVAGAYVRVVVYGATEDEGMPATAVVSGASGTIVDPRGYVVTSAHIVRNTRYGARITTLDGRRHAGRIVDIDGARDLALIMIEPFRGMQVATIADASGLCAGQPVLAIGTPDNRTGVVSAGRISDPRRADRIDFGDFALDDAIELRMKVEPGYSGGPLFDAGGRLAGIIAGFGLGDTRRVPYVSTRIAYAVPSNTVAGYLAEVVGRRAGPRPFDPLQRLVKACDDRRAGIFFRVRQLS